MAENKTTYREDKLKRLKDPAEAVGYLKACLEETDMPDLFLAALRDIAEARGIGMTQLAQDTNLNRENLYRVLSKQGNPELGSLYVILDALGLKLSVELKEAS
ncbi:MAG: addiction module antidote protein [Pseudomonadota bacterium]